MENYLSGRNNEVSSTPRASSSDFRSLSEMASDSAQLIEKQNAEVQEGDVQVETV